MAVHVRVNIDAEFDRGSPIGRRDAAETIRRAAQATLRDHGILDAEISLTLLGDTEIAEMNRTYLRHEGPTDVISFPLHDADEPPLGDVYIGWEQALRQAETHGVDPAEELMRLAIHGTLHVLGYDHPDGEERLESEMWRRQEAILRSLEGV